MLLQACQTEKEISEEEFWQGLTAILEEVVTRVEDAGGTGGRGADGEIHRQWENGMGNKFMDESSGRLRHREIM